MQVAVYVRISKDREGAGLGVQRQKADCLELAESLGWTVVETFNDNDISAYSGSTRPGYNAMCAAMEDGRVEAVIAWHPDRLHRRPTELESFIDLCERKHIEVRTVRAGMVDLSTASGKMVARMLGAAARHEVEHSIERQKAAKKQAALDGKYRGGRRPFGYESDGITLRTEESDAIRKATTDVLSGVSLMQVTRDWNGAGLRTSFGGKEFTSREVRTILLRPRNAGIALHEGKRVGTGQWQPIVDVDTFDALVALLGDPARRTSGGTERKYQGTGVYRCGLCGSTMAMAVHNKRGGEWRRTYMCTASKHLGRDVRYVDEMVDRLVVGRLSQPDAAIVLGASETVDLAGLQAQREGLRARLDELSGMFSVGDIDGPQLKRGTAELRSKMEALDATLVAARASSSMANLVLAGDDLRATWEATAADLRGKVIDALMTVTILPSRRGRMPGGVYFDPSTVRIEWKV